MEYIYLLDTVIIFKVNYGKMWFHVALSLNESDKKYGKWITHYGYELIF